MQELGNAGGFLYALLWIPSLIMFVGLTYYSTKTQLPARLRVLWWLLLAMVLTIPAGLMYTSGRLS